MKSSPGVFTVSRFDPIIAFAYMGGYIANVSDGSHVYLAWGDNRDKVFNVLWPNGRNDPNVYFASNRRNLPGPDVSRPARRARLAVATDQRRCPDRPRPRWGVDPETQRVTVWRECGLAGEHPGHDLEDLPPLVIIGLRHRRGRLGDDRDQRVGRRPDGPRPASNGPIQRASTTNVPSGSVVAPSRVNGAPSARWRTMWGSRWTSGSSATQPSSAAAARRASSRSRCARASATPIPRSSGSQRGGRPRASDASASGRRRVYLSRSALARTAWAAASRATGTRNGEHDT